MTKEKLYKNCYLIAVYEYDADADSEGICLAVFENIKKLTDFYCMEDNERNYKSIKDKINYSIKKSRRRREGIIRIGGENYMISLIPTSKKRKKKSRLLVSEDGFVIEGE